MASPPQGGTTNNGVISKITPAGDLTTFYIFSGPDGSNPGAALVLETDGNFYGTSSGEFYGAAGGGTSTNCESGPCGVTYKITPSGAETVVHSFDSTDGTVPGTPSGEFTTLYLFGGFDGSEPSSLIQATDGNFYGTTSEGGNHGYGTVFQLTAKGSLTTLHDFDQTDGMCPYGGLIEGSDGPNWRWHPAIPDFRASDAGCSATTGKRW